MNQMNFNLFNSNESPNFNYGVKWTKCEYDLLLEEIKEDKSVEEICKNHGKNVGGIKGGIIRLGKMDAKNKFLVQNYYEKNSQILDKKKLETRKKFPNVGTKWNTRI